MTPRREAAVLRTVSRMPEARGLPSRRIGFPPMYFETLSSRVAKVSFHSDAAAVLLVTGAHEQVYGWRQRPRYRPLAKPTCKTSNRLHARVFPNRFSSLLFLQDRILDARTRIHLLEIDTPYPKLGHELLRAPRVRVQPVYDLLQRLNRSRYVGGSEVDIVM